MTKPNPPSAEMDVIACLHRLGPITAAEIREALRHQRPMAHGSVLTLLKRLEAKKLVGRKKGPVGKAFLFFPRQRTRQTIGRVVGDLVRRIFHGDGAALVASLFDTKPPTEQEVEQIQKMLDELRRKSGGGK